MVDTCVCVFEVNVIDELIIIYTGLNTPNWGVACSFLPAWLA